jgi:hypothetical protein
MGQILFYGTVNSGQFVKNILETLFKKLTEEGMSYTYFQKENAPTQYRKLNADCLMSE